MGSAHSRQGEYEELLRVWTTYQDMLERIQCILEELEFEPETPSSLAGVKTSIQKVDTQIKPIQSKKADFDALTAESKKMESQADTINRHQIAEEALGLNQD